MEDFGKSTVLDGQVDIIEEVKKALDDMDLAVRESRTAVVLEQVAYLKFLVGDLEDVLSGEYEHLRRKRLIIKK